MTLFLYKFKKHPVLPVLATVMAILLITGQVLTCCGINESLAASLTKTLQSFGIVQVHEANANLEVEHQSHLNCHGHGIESGSEACHAIKSVMQRAPAEPGQNQYAAKDNCLSERALTVNAQPSDTNPHIHLPVQAQVGFIDECAPLVVNVERPRPMNKSSPPVYLLTLRILV